MADRYKVALNNISTDTLFSTLIFHNKRLAGDIVTRNPAYREVVEKYVDNYAHTPVAYGKPCTILSNKAKIYLDMGLINKAFECLEQLEKDCDRYEFKTMDSWDLRQIRVLRKFFGKYKEWGHVNPDLLRHYIGWRFVDDPKKDDPYARVLDTQYLSNKKDYFNFFANSD